MSERLERPGPRHTRRRALRTAAALAAAGAAGTLAPGARGEGANQAESAAAAKGRLRQSVCRWCYAKIPLADLCAAAKRMGLVGIDLLKPEEFPTIKGFGLACTMTSSHPLANGLCDPKFHGACLEAIHVAIEATAKEGWKNVICFSGNARGIDRETGMKNCIQALKQVVPAAEKAGVILQMELLNSKVNHKDYMCDNSTWGVELVKRVGSGHFKLLYDIYHTQIMEGDVIRTIEANRAHFGHFHTGGNPGRHEIDDTQELKYPAIVRAILDTGYQGFLGQEFIPTRDPLESLAQGFRICDV